MLETILLQEQEMEMEKRYEQHLQQEMEEVQLEHCKKITIKRNAEKQKEMEQSKRLNNFFNALTNFIEE